MGTTNFDAVEVSGVPTMGIGGGLPIAPRYFWVNSVTGSNGNTGAFNNPYATIGQALTAVGVQHQIGDTIVLMQGHSETITGVGGITCSTANVNIIGLGTGTTRPRFLMDGGTTVTAAISAANVYWSNTVFAAGHADIVTCFAITAAGVTLDGLEFVNNVVDENFLTEIKATSTTDNNADGLTVMNCRAITVDASALEMIEINADLDRGTFVNNFMSKDAATSTKFILQATGKDLTNLYCCYNKTISGNTAGDIFIENDTTANSGTVAWNWCGHHDTAAVILTDCDGVRMFGNLSANTDTQSGVVAPAIGTIT